jgi:hypothetical protein
MSVSQKKMNEYQFPRTDPFKQAALLQTAPGPGRCIRSSASAHNHRRRTAQPEQQPNHFLLKAQLSLKHSARNESNLCQEAPHIFKQPIKLALDVNQFLVICRVVFKPGIFCS